MKKHTGPRWEITVDGRPRSYRDRRQIAIESAEYLKSKNPNVEVTVRDMTTGETTVIEWRPPRPESFRGLKSFEIRRRLEPRPGIRIEPPAPRF
jgi:hypothetical protein